MSFVYPGEYPALMACVDVPLQRRILYGVLAREGMRYGEGVDDYRTACLVPTAEVRAVFDAVERWAA